jgi:hypothetical protein
MKQAALKKKLHQFIDDINDDTLLEAVYTILNSSWHKPPYEISDEDIRIIEERSALYEAGKLKTETLAEFKKKMRKRLSK